MLALRTFLRDKRMWFDERSIAAESGGAAGFSGVGYGSRRCAAGRQQPYSDTAGNWNKYWCERKCRPGIKSVAGDYRIAIRGSLPPVI